MRYPDHLLKLIGVLKKLPGVGSRSAERFAFQLIDWSPEKLAEMGDIIKSIKENLNYCSECGALIETKCPLCSSSRRDPHLLCIVASSKDIFAIEETREYQGHYHVLGSLLSPLQGQSISSGTIENIKNRISKLQITEVIIALDATLEGDATSLFLKKELSSLPLSISRLALGLPMGTALDFIDGGTLGRALAYRRNY